MKKQLGAETINPPYTFAQPLWDSRLGRFMLSFGLNPQFFRYVIGGVITVLADMAVMAILLAIPVHYQIATLGGFFTGFLLHYLLAIKWIFEYRRFAGTRKEFFIFFVLCILGTVQNVVLMYVCVELLLFPPLFARAGVIACLFVVNYFIKKQVLFCDLGRGRTKSALAQGVDPP